jgi:hypothetical protein
MNTAAKAPQSIWKANLVSPTPSGYLTPPFFHYFHCWPFIVLPDEDATIENFAMQIKTIGLVVMGLGGENLWVIFPAINTNGYLL